MGSDESPCKHLERNMLRQKKKQLEIQVMTTPKKTKRRPLLPPISNPNSTDTYRIPETPVGSRLDQSVQVPLHFIERFLQL